MPSIISATTTTGLVTNADNSGSLQLATNNGTTAVTIDTSQNVGIGTASPASKLDIVGSTTGAVQQFIKNSNGATNSSADLVFGNWSGSTPVAPQAKISAINAASSDARTDLAFSTYTGLALTERMRIDSSGRVLVGLTSWAGGATNAGVAIKSTSNSSSIFAFYIDNTSSNILNVRCDGSTYNTTGVWGTISDQRLKENIVDATPKLNNLLQLKVRNFNFTDDENKTKQIGFVAQEIEQVFPSLVSEDAEGTKAVKTTVLLPMLVKAIQEQQAMITELKTELDSVKAELATLKGAA
jgi:trimeric autotransporter adhesin